LLRLACTTPRIWLIPLLISLAGCTTQAPYWERYRAEPGQGTGGPADAFQAQDSDAGGPSAPANGALRAAFAPHGHAPLAPGGRSFHALVLDPRNPFSDLDVLDTYLEGVASWYGPGFHGERTANGEVYNQYGLTAAHPMLPLGTKIEVRNQVNGRKVWLRVNDRGPYKKGRILDLSKLAAEQLGIVDDGTAPVSIRVVRWPERVDASHGLRAYTQFVVQVVSRPDPAEAERFRANFARRFPALDFRIDRPPGSHYTVVVGPYPDESMARSAATHLQQDGVTCLVRSFRK
jgi:rare lipoprotein A